MRFVVRSLQIDVCTGTAKMNNVYASGTEKSRNRDLEMDIFCKMLEMLDIKAVPVRQTSKYRV